MVLVQIVARLPRFGHHDVMLSASELEQFAEQGFVHLRSAFPSHLAGECRDFAAMQLNIDVNDSTSWCEPVVRGLVEGEPLRAAANSPRLLEAIHQLLDPDPWLSRPNLGLFVVRFPTEADPGDAGWHIDSSFESPDRRWYVNYRSRQRGLLLLCLLSDVDVEDAPTRIMAGSHLKIPSLLRPFGDDGVFGLHAPLPESTEPITLATGEAGDVYLCHPFLLHAASWPHRGTAPRFVAQPPISLAGDVRLEGGDDELSPVGRAVKTGLHHLYPRRGTVLVAVSLGMVSTTGDQRHRARGTDRPGSTVILPACREGFRL